MNHRRDLKAIAELVKELVSKHTPTTLEENIKMRKIRLTITEDCGCGTTTKASTPDTHDTEEARMHRTTLAHLMADVKVLLDMVEDEDDLPEWLETKITKAGDYMSSAARYIAGNVARDQGQLEEDIKDRLNSLLNRVDDVDDDDKKQTPASPASPTSEPAPPPVSPDGRSVTIKARKSTIVKLSRSNASRLARRAWYRKYGKNNK